MVKTSPLTPEWAKERLELEISQAHERYKKRLAQIDKLNEISPQMRDEDRYEEAVRLREQGLTFTEIGAKLGVTRGWANQMVKIGLRMRENPNKSLTLSVRARNAIYHSLAAKGVPTPSEDLTPSFVSKHLTLAEIFAQPNAGKRTVNEIRAWIETHV